MQEKFKDGRKFHFEGSFWLEPVDIGRIYLYQLGELCCQPGYEVALHDQCCHEISYIISGSGTFTDNGKEYSVSEGDIFISPYGHKHSIIASSPDSLRFVYLGFMIKRDNTHELLMIDSFFRNNTVLKQRDKSDIILPFTRGLDEFYILPKCSRIMTECYAMQIIISTYRTFSLRNIPKPQRAIKDSSVAQPVYSVLRYIDNNIFNLPDMKTMAEQLGYSNYYLSHIFKEQMNITIKQYISKKKIQKGIELLKTRQFSITQIARKLNYSNVQSFSRMFKQITGVSPSEYIEKYTHKKPVISQKSYDEYISHQLDWEI